MTTKQLSLEDLMAQPAAAPRPTPAPGRSKTLVQNSAQVSKAQIDTMKFMSGVIHSNKDKPLPEGWYTTEQYGDVYIPPGSKVGWTVQRQGNNLFNVAVTVGPGDLIKSKVDTLKETRARKSRRIRQLERTKAANFGAGDGRG